MWNLPPPPKFQGLREDLPLEAYIRQLPHWRQNGATYFVTFRLADSLPQTKLHELRGLKVEWERKHPPPRSHETLEKFARETFELIDCWLDAGCGSCVLRNAEASSQIIQPMHHFDGERYELGCYVVMPNHVHVIVRPMQPQTHPLENILKSWKSYAGRRINEFTGKSGELWQVESYDRIIRDEEHLWHTIQYIGRNPQKAQLSPEICSRWIRPEWEALGWKFINDV